MSRYTLLIIALILACGTTAHAAFTSETCLAQKRKAQGKFQKCRAIEDANALQGKPADLAKCSTKFQDKIAKLSEKASEIGFGCRYLDNGNGTVTDYDTGLQWEKKDSPGGGFSICPGGATCNNPHDVDNGYDWSISGSAADGGAFGDFLSKLNHHTADPGGGPIITVACFAFRCDWRLPTLGELQTILLEPDPCGTSPCIDPIFGSTAANFYWSATTHASLPNAAWGVNFSIGNVSAVGKSGNGHVRAVRGGL